MKNCSRKWVPITTEELRVLLHQGLLPCSVADLELFDRIKIEPRRVGFERGRITEEVFAVAQIGSKYLFFDDVEDAFEIAEPDADGVIRGITGQFTICHAIAQIRTGKR